MVSELRKVDVLGVGWQTDLPILAPMAKAGETDQPHQVFRQAQAAREGSAIMPPWRLILPSILCAASESTASAADPQGTTFHAPRAPV